MLKKIVGLVFIFAACALFAKAQTPAPTPEKPWGWKMSVKDADATEALLKQNPKDSSRRASIIAYYQNKDKEDAASRKSLQRHRVLLIQNTPDEASSAYLGQWTEEEDRTKPEFIELKNELLKQVTANKNSSKIRSIAVEFLAVLEPATAERLLREGQSIEPENLEYADSLIGLFLSNIERLDRAYDAQEKSVTLAAINDESKKLMTEIERRLSLFKTEGYLKEVPERLNLLIKAAKVALELDDSAKAKKYAETILADFITAEPDEDDNKAIFYGNMLLARVAVREKNLAVAKERLFKSLNFIKVGDWKISEPELDVLADLLAAGEKTTVIEYARQAQKASDETMAKTYRLWERKLSRNLSPLVLDSEYN